MSSFSYDGTHLTSFSAISGQASAPAGPSTSASALLPKSAPTLLRDFDPILDELKAENNCNFEANQRLSGNNVTTIENVYSGVPLLQDSNIACCSSSTTATPSPEPPSEPPPPLPQSGMYSAVGLLITIPFRFPKSDTELGLHYLSSPRDGRGL